MKNKNVIMWTNKQENENREINILLHRRPSSKLNYTL